MRGAGLASAAVIACLALTACQDDPVGPVDPDDTATPGAAASTTPTPTGPTPPPLPDDATADTPEAAVQFVIHYIDLLNYAANTGDVAPLRSASRDCDGCQKYAEYYENVYENGGSLTSPGWQPVSPVGYDTGAGVTVLTDVQAGAVTAVPERGASPTTGRDSIYALRFEVGRVDDKWAVRRLQGESK